MEYVMPRTGTHPQAAGYTNSASSLPGVEAGHEGARHTLVPGDEDAFGRRRVDADVGLVAAGAVVPAPDDVPRPVEPEHDRIVGTCGREQASGHGELATVICGREQRAVAVH